LIKSQLLYQLSYRGNRCLQTLASFLMADA
jgi:hypothetical protein